MYLAATLAVDPARARPGRGGAVAKTAGHFPNCVTEPEIDLTVTAGETASTLAYEPTPRQSMNNLTEDQARTKECPLTKIRDHRGEQQCCASNCMAWRWQLDDTGAQVTDAAGSAVGRCGLCGPDMPAVVTQVEPAP